MAESTLIRDLFNPTVVQQLATSIKRVYPPFEADAFTQHIVSRLGELTYSERIILITEALEQYLPTDPQQAIQLLIDALPSEAESTSGQGVRGFIIVTLTRYVSRNALPHFDLSMKALYEMTKHMTAEWDIRPFIVRYPDETIAVLHTWATDPNQHVRRLVSEGSRPRLPWGMRLHQFIKNPLPVIALLDKLKNDPELYVRRSVANNLNDIAKDHPQLVVDTLKRWQPNASAGTQWIIKHATRTLIKMGHSEALLLLGFDPALPVAVSPLTLDTDTVQMGGSLTLSFSVTCQATQPANVVIDYCIYYQRANGSLAPKVYKVTTQTLAPGQVLQLSPKRSFKPISTRVFYPGRHEVSILVNGQEHSRTGFQLV